MSIKPRTTYNEHESKGRHPLLKIGSLHSMIWHYVKNRPDSTRREISEGLNIRLNTVGPRVKELIDHGLLYHTGQIKVYNESSRQKCLRVASGRETGSSRDLLKIKVDVYLNNKNEYSIKAKVVNQSPTADGFMPTRIATKTVSVLVPRLYEVKESSPVETVNIKDLTIEDVDYTIVG